MKKAMLKSWMAAAGCALFAVSASATQIAANSFESGVDGWTGNGSKFGTNYTYNASVGQPLSGTHDYVLLVEGMSSNAASTTASSPATVDMMVQIALPDEELTAFPTSAGDTRDVQIAVGVTPGSTSEQGKLKVYCLPKSGTADWFALNGVDYDKDSWHRVSFTFDYAHQLCQIRVDGEPIMSANGYLTTDTTNLPDTPGSWYKLATTTTPTALASIQVIGCTAIDDVLVKDGSSIDDVLPVLADAGVPTVDSMTGIAMSNSWIEAQGITRAQAQGQALDDSGMTVGQKYAAGYDVADGKKFGVKTMSMSGTTATVTFDPANVKTGYTYKLATSTDNSTWSDEITISAGEALAGSKTIDLGNAAVKYLRLKVVQQ